MKELVFESSLSPEEIERNFQNFDFFTAMKKSLQEAIDYEVHQSAPGVTVHTRTVREA